MTVYWLPGNPWPKAILGSLAFHALLLGGAYLCSLGVPFHHGPTCRVVAVAPISLVPGRSGLAGGGGPSLPVKQPKPQPPKAVKPKKVARKLPARPRPKPKEHRERQRRQEAVPPPPSLALARPTAPPGEGAAAKSSIVIGSGTGSGTAARSGQGSGTGSGIGPGTGTGPGGPGTGSGNASVLQGYLMEVRRLLERHKDYPREARRKHLQGLAVLRFTIEADGRVNSSRLARPSGHELLDRAVKETLRRVGRFPPLPSNLGRERLTIEVPLAFRLRDN